VESGAVILPRGIKIQKEIKHKMIKYVRSTPFWDIAWWLVVHSDVLGKCITHSFRGQAVQLKMPQW